MTPTVETYQELQLAYSHFNSHLFNNQLPNCLITLQREKNTYGYFSAQRFGRKDGSCTDEIAMNPTYFGVVPLIEIMQTVVHESVHLWQHHFATPGRRRYHNQEWADKMESIGLMPSSTGKPGGKRTGERMADYVIEGGAFQRACDDLFTRKFKISWFDRFPPRKIVSLYSPNHTVTTSTQQFHEIEDDEIPKEISQSILQIVDSKKQTRAKYSCMCGVNVWGKPGLNLICGECQEAFNPNN